MCLHTCSDCIECLKLILFRTVDKNTGINGLIPSELGMLTDLKCLELDTNDFDSPIPTSVKDILGKHCAECRVGVLLLSLGV